MLTIITNHYLLKITPINLCIIHFKNLYYVTYIPFLPFKVIFLKTTILNLGRAHR